ncbi:shikimate dehydrogenase [Aquihabitans sp. G128]|uniref:shikimate dehydrogenase n=1 Tax=Aquihabitans sp. G128 TaxID=2849779 RepID=UPI001C2224F4|nr:shikimate dehydrogenase [Aquihabitans sp. G128]QXC61864.1 shikimate dehydrogenase [Aquihabitans sp. G128]
MADGGPVSVPLTGATRIAAVIGSPIHHSRSPLLANAAFRAAGLDWALAAFEVAPGRAGDAVAAVRALGLGGLMVTMPHKADIIAFLDRTTPAAAALGAVNSVAWEGTELVGDNTDGPGLVASLRTDEGIDPTGRRCLVLGAGGAARSVAWALGDAGAAEVVVVNRTKARAAVAAALAGPSARVGTEADVARAEIVVNATSVGMGAEVGAAGPLPVPGGALHDGQVVVDLVYQPLETPLLRAAAAAGARPVDGLGMLVHQAALSIERWTGVAPDVAAMQAAARR